MPTRRLTKLARNSLAIVLIPSVLCGQIPTAAQETIDQLQDSPGLSINTAPDCCDPPSIWDFLGYHDVEQHIHGKLHEIAELPLFAGLLKTLGTGLAMVGLGPSPAGDSGLPGGAGPEGAPTGAGGAAGDIAAKIEADKAAADAKIQTLEYLAKQDCNAYPEIVPAILAELDDPNEPVRYAALVALQRQCSELRCSTLPATRIRYRLHGDQFVSHCRQCASCSCQEQVIKRLSDLLLDKTVLGFPKENSPRVRSLAAAIIERCLQVHPPGPAPDPTQEIKPDPPPQPLPDPTPAGGSASTRLRFLSVPSLKGRLSRTGSWFRNLLGRIKPTRKSPAVYLGQDQEVSPGWNATGADGASAPHWVEVESRWSDEERPSEEQSQWSQVDALRPGSSASENNIATADEHVEQIRSTVADAEERIRNCFAGRNGPLQAEFESATVALFDARLALALSGDAQQLANLVTDAEALWDKDPGSFAAVTALNTLTDYYAALAKHPTTNGTQSLVNYSRCLRFQLQRLDSYPEEAPQRLLYTAKALWDANLIAEATESLQVISEHCSDCPAGAHATRLLAKIESSGVSTAAASVPSTDPEVADAPAGSAVEPAAERLPINEMTADQLYVVISDAEQRIQTTYADRAGTSKDAFEAAMAELCEARLHLALRGDTEQHHLLLHTASALCEKEPNSPSAAQALDALTRYYKWHIQENAPERLTALSEYAKCLRYQLALLDSPPEDVPQGLVRAATALLESGMHAEAVDSLNLVLDRCPHDSAGDDAAALLAELDQPSASDRDESTPIADRTDREDLSTVTEDTDGIEPSVDRTEWTPASVASTESEPAVSEPVASEPVASEPVASEPVINEPVVSETVSGEPVVVVDAQTERADTTAVESDQESDPPQGTDQWQGAIADAESEIKATFADRFGASKSRYESAVASLCEARLQLALRGDHSQFHQLYKTVSVLCEKEPNTTAAALALDALTEYYEWHVERNAPERQSALGEYAKCLRYRVARFDPVPEAVTSELMGVANDLLAYGMTAEAADCLRSIQESSSNPEFANEASRQLAALEPQQSPEEPASAQVSTAQSEQKAAPPSETPDPEWGGELQEWQSEYAKSADQSLSNATSDVNPFEVTGLREAGSDDRQPESVATAANPVPVSDPASRPSVTPPVESSESFSTEANVMAESTADMVPPAPDTSVGAVTMQGDSGMDPIDRLYATVEAAEQEIDATFADRHGSARDRYLEATSILCEARLELALAGDKEQFQILYEDAETLSALEPDSHPAAFAMAALSRYYASQVNVTTPEGLSSLRKYAGCLRFQVSKLKACSAQTPQELFDVVHSLREAGLTEDAPLLLAGFNSAAVRARRSPRMPLLSSRSCSPLRLRRSPRCRIRSRRPAMTVTGTVTATVTLTRREGQPPRRHGPSRRFASVRERTIRRLPLRKSSRSTRGRLPRPTWSRRNRR